MDVRVGDTIKITREGVVTGLKNNGGVTYSPGIQFRSDYETFPDDKIEVTARKKNSYKVGSVYRSVDGANQGTYLRDEEGWFSLKHPSEPMFTYFADVIWPHWLTDFTFRELT